MSSTDRAAAEADHRARRLDERFGDPGDDSSETGWRALLRADERAEPPAAAEALLDAEGFGAELVPVALGGRLERADTLVRVLRPVFRRDVGLGLGHGITSLFAASPVFAAGTARQRAEVAALLCGGGRAAIVHRSLAHGTALLRGELTAVRGGSGGGMVLGGRKDVVLNA
ncbi:acyl-CoA dehydrogenase, partial [Streptomyces sp. BG9H]|nr:acyl-CoA dehydrogenase [Streptomyces anatolicus]